MFGSDSIVIRLSQMSHVSEVPEHRFDRDPRVVWDERPKPSLVVLAGLGNLHCVTSTG
jgi:hypothetical protein